MEPISQVQTYCVNCGTRYGYTITDSELVVLRVHTLRPKESPNWIRTHAETRITNERSVNPRSAPKGYASNRDIMDIDSRP